MCSPSRPDSSLRLPYTFRRATSSASKPSRQPVPPEQPICEAVFLHTPLATHCAHHLPLISPAPRDAVLCRTLPCRLLSPTRVTHNPDPQNMYPKLGADPDPGLHLPGARLPTRSPKQRGPSQPCSLARKASPATRTRWGRAPSSVASLSRRSSCQCSWPCS